MNTLWPTQTRALERIAQVQPKEALCVTSPTGGGKGRIMEEILIRFAQGQDALLLTHRRKLLEQQAQRLESRGLRYDVMAAGWERRLGEPIQLAMIPSLLSRCEKSDVWNWPKADWLLVDEAHVQANGKTLQVIQRYKRQGARVIGFTATPIGLAHLYDSLFVAGANSELRRIGALVPAVHYAPTEPDFSKANKAIEKLNSKEISRYAATKAIAGHIWDWFCKLNPTREPTICFGPGVQESQWIAQDFQRRGVDAAHIDGKDFWVKGEWNRDDRSLAALQERMEQRDVVVVSNRFVLREGIDFPFLRHCIFATPFQSLQSYLQAGGRVLRAAPNKTHVTIQDHGGNYWIHGEYADLNCDKDWRLSRRAVDYISVSRRRIAEGEADQPFACPKCAQVQARMRPGECCVYCGYQVKKPIRRLHQTDGRLRASEALPIPERKYDKRRKVEQIWKQYYFRGKKAGMTFNQAEALYMLEQGYRYPPPGLPFMPINDWDWCRKIRDVPEARLI